MVRTACLIACLVASAATPAQTPIPVKDFARKPDILSAKLSPNGEYLAVSMRTGGQIGIGVIDLANLKISGAMAFGHGDLPTNYWWVGPNRLVAEVGKSYGPLDQPYRMGEMFAMNADGSGKRYLFGYRGEQQIGSRLKRGAAIDHAWAFMLDPLPHDPLHALIEVRPWSKNFYDSLPFIDLINVDNSERRRVGTSPLFFPDIGADDTGQPRFVAGTNKEGKCCELRARAPGDSAWTEVQLPSGMTDHVRLHAVGRAGKSAFLSSPGPDGGTCLREYHFDSKVFTTLACHANVQPHVTLSRAERRPIALRYENGRPEMAYPDPEHSEARLLRSLEKSFPGQRLSEFSQTADGTRLVFLVDSDRSPGDFYLVNRTTKKVDYLLGRSKWIDPAAMQPVEPIRVPARDGMALNGYLTAAEGLKARKAPMVVLPHGGPHYVRDYWQWNADAQLLASRGYAVLQINYRGSGGYGQAFQQAGYRKWGTQMQDDLTDAVKWAIAQGIADPQRVCIYGASYGGYAALMSATREPELYRCAAGFAGVYDLVEQADDSDIGDSWFGRTYLQKVLGGDAKVLREHSPVAHVDQLKAAVLIGHGTDDRRVPFSQAKLLRNALDKAGKKYEWHEYPGEEHGFWKDENQEDFYNKLLAFLDKHIGRGATTAAASGG